MNDQFVQFNHISDINLECWYLIPTEISTMVFRYTRAATPSVDIHVKENLRGNI
jgi:hypothetical protein